MEPHITGNRHDTATHTAHTTPLHPCTPHLQPCVHFHEEVVLLLLLAPTIAAITATVNINNEFNSSGTAVTNCRQGWKCVWEGGRQPVCGQCWVRGLQQQGGPAAVGEFAPCLADPPTCLGRCHSRLSDCLSEGLGDAGGWCLLYHLQQAREKRAMGKEGTQVVSGPPFKADSVNELARLNSRQDKRCCTDHAPHCCNTGAPSMVP